MPLSNVLQKQSNFMRGKQPAFKRNELSTALESAYTQLGLTPDLSHKAASSTSAQVSDAAEAIQNLTQRVESAGEEVADAAKSVAKVIEEDVKEVTKTAEEKTKAGVEKLPTDLRTLTKWLHRAGIINKDSNGLLPRLLNKQNLKAAIARGEKEAPEESAPELKPEPKHEFKRKEEKAKVERAKSSDNKYLKQIADNTSQTLKLLKKVHQPKTGFSALLGGILGEGAAEAAAGDKDSGDTFLSSGGGKEKKPGKGSKKAAGGAAKAATEEVKSTGRFGKVMSRLGGFGKGLARVGGPLGTVLGLMTVGSDVMSAQSDKSDQLRDLDQQIQMGALTKGQAAERRNQIEGQADKATGVAVGSGTGAIAGGLAGAEAGAALGSFIPIPVVGTLAGGLAGGIAGSIAGSGVGGWLGEKAGNAWHWAFGGSDGVERVDKPKIDTAGGTKPLTWEELESLQKSDPKAYKQYVDRSQGLYSDYLSTWHKNNQGEPSTQVQVQLADAARGMAANELRQSLAKNTQGIEPAGQPASALATAQVSDQMEATAAKAGQAKKVEQPNVAISSPTINNVNNTTQMMHLRPFSTDPTIQRYIQGNW